MTRRGVPRFVGVVVLVVVVGLTGAVAVAYEISRQREAQDDRNECALGVLTDLVEAANERTTYTEELSRANQDQLKSFRALVEASLRQPPPKEAEARQIVIDYRDALDEYFAIAEKAQKSRQNNPYPTEQDIAECR